MPSLRIGIDVGGTFTHGVVLRPPGEVVYSARVPTTHSHEHGVAEGVRQVLRELLAHAEPADIELVAHSTTQATNALLEGDVAPVILACIVPTGEDLTVRQALPQGRLDLGGGHSVELTRVLIPWEQAWSFEPEAVAGNSVAQASLLASGADGKLEACPTKPPVAVVQPLAGQQELRESQIAAKYRALGHPVVCAADITQVLGLAARARTAVVNASMLPKMLATARFTAQAVGELLPGAAVQVVRSDGGAMSLDEMQRLPVLSLLSGPAAGASAALARSGLSNVVFIEVGGTSTDITLIKDGRVRHRYATVGGQRLLVPALDLRTVAVGGGSMLRADTALFGPRSAHIAGLPYLFQALQTGLEAVGAEKWTDSQSGIAYVVAKMSDGSLASFTMTDAMLCMSTLESASMKFNLSLDDETLLKCKAGMRLCAGCMDFRVPESRKREMLEFEMMAWKMQSKTPTKEELAELVAAQEQKEFNMRMVMAHSETCDLAAKAIKELAAAHDIDLRMFKLRAGGGGGGVADLHVAGYAGIPLEKPNLLIPDHAVISAIGAALAVSCVSLSKSVAEPSAGDIAELTAEVERRLSAQGAERVSTDYEFDSQRQVLTVTGRGSQPYAQDAKVRGLEELTEIANRLVNENATPLWQTDQLSLWRGEDSGTTDSAKHEKRTIGVFFKKLFSKPEPWMQAVLLNHYGQCLWQGTLREFWPAAGSERETVLKQILELRTEYTDGGPVLPGLALACAGRLIPLDQLASADLIAEVLRWEQLPPDAGGCFLLRG